MFSLKDTTQIQTHIHTNTHIQTQTHSSPSNFVYCCNKISIKEIRTCESEIGKFRNKPSS